MKNIETILKEAGLEVTAEQLAAIDKEVKENYKTAVDYDKQKDKLAAAEDKVKTGEDKVACLYGAKSGMSCKDLLGHCHCHEYHSFKKNYLPVKPGGMQKASGLHSCARRPPFQGRRCLHSHTPLPKG